MTCKELGGACDKEFHAENFEEMAELSKKHGMEMYKKGDAKHLKAMQEMMKIMKDPKAMDNWMKTLERRFDELPKD